MQIGSIGADSWDMCRPAYSPPAAGVLKTAEQNEADCGDGDLRDAFQSFVGQTLFGQMLSAMRKTVGKPAYFHGGRGEEMFRQQLDQVLAEKMADASGGKYSDAMYDLFTMPRRP